jgi:hypothetical protein
VIDHATPKTIVGDKEYPLVFPRFLINVDTPKTIDMLFIGLITDKRREWLKQFPDATIVDSLRGRKEHTRIYDTTYFNQMAKTKFVLCPDGDFTWTYRFFEAILCGAIPIIQNYCELYEGYFHLRVHPSNRYHYGRSYIKKNIKKLEREMML